VQDGLRQSAEQGKTAPTSPPRENLMHPAFSIIFFTTLSGAGFGAMAAAGLLSRFVGETGFWTAAILGFVLAAVGLLSSVAHLKSPTRARFALSQWRTSWLSREGVLAIATMGLAFVGMALIASGSSWQFERTEISAWMGNPVAMAAGFVMLGLCVATVRATGMIYQSIGAVPAWSGQPTSLIFLLFSATSGSVIILAASDSASNMGYGVALFFLFTVWYFKITVWGRVDKAAPIATIGSATGLGDDNVRLFERPHVTENWLTKEMGFRVARRHSMKFRMIAVILGGVLPAAVIALPLAGLAPHGVCWLAAIIHIGGVMVERWLFFAEAKHVQSLYYGEAAV
jgi:DMSO reductase anchor subunit